MKSQYQERMSSLTYGISEGKYFKVNVLIVLITPYGTNLADSVSMARLHNSHIIIYNHDNDSLEL